MPTAAIDFAPAIAGFTNAFIREREARESRQAKTGQVLFEAAKADPTLFDDPQAAKAMEKYVGDKEAFGLVKNLYQNQPTAEQIAYQQAQAMGVVTPEEQAAVTASEQEAQRAKAINRAGAPKENPIAAIARSVIGAVPGVGGPASNALLGPAPVAPNLPVPNPYAGAKGVLGERGPTVPGATVSMTAKGGTQVSRTGPTRRDADEALVNRATAMRVGEIRQENPSMSQANAMIQSAREVFRAATAEGKAIPKWIESLATGESENVIKLGLEQGKKALDLAYAAPLAGATEAGKRGAQMAVPKTPEEAAAAAVNEARTPDGQPLGAAEKAALLQQYREQFRQGSAYASAAGTAQASLEKEARKSANDLSTLNESIANLVPIAATALTSSPLRAKARLQQLELFAKSGEGIPAIAAMNNLSGLKPRITRLVGGDVGNLAIQEQAAYTEIMEAKKQTAQEFVTNMLMLGMSMDRLAAAKAEVLGLPAPKGGQLRTALEKIRTKNPEIDAALTKFEAATIEVSDDALRGRVAASLGIAPTAPAEVPAGAAGAPGAPSPLDLGDGFSLTIGQ